MCFFSVKSSKEQNLKNTILDTNTAKRTVISPNFLRFSLLKSYILIEKQQHFMLKPHQGTIFEIWEKCEFFFSSVSSVLRKRKAENVTKHISDKTSIRLGCILYVIEILFACTSVKEN